MAGSRKVKGKPPFAITLPKTGPLFLPFSARLRERERERERERDKLRIRFGNREALN